MKIATTCHRRLNRLLPRWMARALPCPEGAEFVLPPAAGGPPPAEPAASIAPGARGRESRAAREERAERNDESVGAPSSRPARPLRVLRIVEEASACASGAAGRLVISGRMADVCAELERLAALESRRRCA